MPSVESDAATVARQLGRPVVPFTRVAARCPFGAPAVVETPPYSVDGTPFPTRLYLTCPSLRRRVGALEDAGLIRALEARVAASPGARDRLAAAQAADRRARAAAFAADPPAAAPLDGGASLEHRGIAGAGDDRRLKCLHAHAALALAEPAHLVGTWVLWRALPAGWCAGVEGCRSAG